MNGWVWAYRIFWVVWLAVGIGVESLTLLNHRKGDTLSEFFWTVSKDNKLAAYLILAFLLWLLVHFMTRGRFA